MALDLHNSLIDSLSEQLGRKAKELVEGMRKRVQRDPDIADFAVAFKAILAPDAMTRPGGNKTLPRCEVPDCVNQASFVINERPLCFAHAQRNPLPPSLRKNS